jgi:hypothetical protein
MTKYRITWGNGQTSSLFDSETEAVLFAERFSLPRYKTEPVHVQQCQYPDCLTPASEGGLLCDNCRLQADEQPPVNVLIADDEYPPWLRDFTISPI